MCEGFPFSFGVFQEYYSTHEPFSADPKGIAVIGTTATVIPLPQVISIVLLMDDRA